VTQFNVSLLIRGDGSDAEAALRKAGTEVAKLGTAAQTASRQTTALGTAQRKAAGDAELLASKSQLAAGSVGNLFANFNDIGMMMAAGQSPLQLALQQGTSISQVLGPMGAAGAVRALGAAFLQLVSPINLITIGAIAAGAAMFQWLTSSGEAALTAEDKLKSLEDAVERYVAASKRASSSTASMRAEFGAAAEDVRMLAQEMSQAALRQAERDAQGFSDSLAGNLQMNFPAREIGDQKRLGDALDLSLWSRESRSAINSVIAAMDGLANARGIDAQIAATERLRDRFKSAAEASGSISASEDETLALMNRQLQTLSLIAAERARANAARYLEERAADRGDRPADISRRLGDRDAQADIASLQQEAEIRRLIARYGEDSLQVTFARHDAERAVFAALVGQRNASAEVKAELMQAWDAANALPGVFALAQNSASLLGIDLFSGLEAANGIASADIAGRIAAALGPAGALAARLWDAAAAAAAAAQAQARLEEIRFGASPGGQALNRYGSRTPGGTPEQNSIAIRNRPVAIGTGRAGSAGGGGGAARAEADAIGELITRLQGEIDLAREADPVQREMLRLRKELTGATSAQRTEVETLIATREREKAAMESLNYVSEQMGDALIDALTGAAGAGERLIQTLSRAVLQAALLGQGPLAGLFGGVGLFGARPGGGGILGAILGTVIRPSVSASASAASVAPSPPRFGKAGVTASAGFAGSGASAGLSRVQITLGPGLMAQILDQARDQSIEITQTGLQTYDREALPARVQAIGRDPRRKG
jgi:hypothetical protein